MKPPRLTRNVWAYGLAVLFGVGLVVWREQSPAPGDPPTIHVDVYGTVRSSAPMKVRYMGVAATAWISVEPEPSLNMDYDKLWTSMNGHIESEGVLHPWVHPREVR